jgi:transcriptional regulator of acetoin/glycerol metabolism
MDIRRPHQTTEPSARTDGSAVERRVVGLRWVFPRFDRPTTPLENEPVVLGRGEECDVQLEGSEASRKHARIRREGPIFVIGDLGSRNGVFVNGTRIDEGPIGVGDVIRLGEWIAVVVRAPAGDGAPSYGEIARGLYAGPVLAAILEPVRRAAPSDLPIVVVGETGTGKERVARAVHEWSGRQGAFVGVNCAALPESLAEAELFGYRKGAFTGAERDHPGHFRAAAGGTLLLDEITDLPLAVQAKLLRAIEQREVLPLGASTPTAVDVRIVAAAQQSLATAVNEKRFRADLYARLDGLTVELPPLRERLDEVPYLFGCLLNERSGGRPPEVEPRLIEQLCLYDLPFNVRELDLLAKRLLVLHGHEKRLERAHLPERFLRASVRKQAAAAIEAPAAADAEAAQFDDLLKALRRHRGVVSRAASDVGISRQSAYRLMDIHGGVDLGSLRAPEPSEVERAGT